MTSATGRGAWRFAPAGTPLDEFYRPLNESESAKFASIVAPVVRPADDGSKDEYGLPYPCWKRGKSTGEIAVCSTCQGSFKLKVFECGEPANASGKCCIEKMPKSEYGVKGVCGKCPLREKVKPTPTPKAKRDCTLVNLTGHYNGSIIDFHGRTLLLSRLHHSQYMSVLGPDNQPTSTVPLILPHALCVNGQEDGRAYVYRDKLRIVFAGITSGKTTDTYRVHQVIAELDDEFQVTGIWAPQYGKQEREKNWSPFVVDDRQFFVYSIAPHVVIEVEDDRVVNEFVTDNPLPFSGGHLRGGAPPILRGDRFLSIFHGNLPIPKPGKWPDYLYSTGAYEFEAKPPFRVVCQTPMPLMWANDGDIAHEVGGNRRGDVRVIFPSGSVDRGDKVIVSQGAADNRIELMEFGLNAIDSAMKTVPRIGTAEASPGLNEELGVQVAESQSLPGWCTLPKAEELARIVLQEKLKVCVEVGVFGGRSLVPVALALRHLGAGIVHGVDSWDAVSPTEGSLSDADREWWSNVDGPAILSGFVNAIRERKLSPFVRILNTTSQRASAMFHDGEVDMLHADGNHSEETSLRDVRLWLPKVRSGGTVIFDDTEYESQSKALALLGAACHPYFRERINPDGVGRWRVYQRL